MSSRAERDRNWWEEMGRRRGGVRDGMKNESGR